MTDAYPTPWDKLLTKTYQNLRIGLVRVDLEGHLLEADDGFARLLNYPNVESLKSTYPYGIWVNPDEQGALIQTLQSSQEDVRWQTSLCQQGGSEIQVEFYGYAVRDSAGNMQYYEGAYRDISQAGIIHWKSPSREAELQYRAEFERQVLNISNRLINVRTEMLVSELEKALGEIGKFARVDRCHIFLFSQDGKTINCLVEWNREGISGPFKEKLQGIPHNIASSWSKRMRSLETVYFNSVGEIPEEEVRLRQMANWLGEKSIIHVPISSAGRLVGYLALASVTEERRWSEEEIQLPRLLAEIIANALERQEAEGRIGQQLTNLAALHKIGKAITSKTEIGSVMNVVLEQVVQQLGVDAAVILLYDPKNNSLYFGSGRGFKPGRATTALRYLQNPLLEKAVAGREMIHMPIPEDWLDIWGSEGFTDYVGVPLVAKGEVNGVLELYRRRPYEPNEDWLAFMFMVAETAAIAIDNVSLFQKEQRAKRNLEQAYESTLESWALMLEMRDQETELHSKRVVDWTLRLARLMGMDGDMMIHLRHGALLHDIGKIFIPNEIFHKTGALSIDEWNEIKKHPEYAYRLLSPIQFLRPALDIVYCHHEWWDGSGYPRALKGEEIPLAARIFTVVDVWDALTQDRPYRMPPHRKWEKRRAMDYLREQAGKKFDPRVVKAFLYLLDNEMR